MKRWILFISFLLLFFFPISNVSATTANPRKDSKPCTPPCCKELKASGLRMYFCGEVYYKCIVQCQMVCVDRDGFLLPNLNCGSYIVEKPAFCKYFAGYTVESNYYLDPTEKNNCNEETRICVKIEPGWKESATSKALLRR